MCLCWVLVLFVLSECEAEANWERKHLNCVSLFLQISSISQLTPAKRLCPIHLLHVFGCTEKDKIKPESSSKSKTNHGGWNVFACSGCLFPLFKNGRFGRFLVSEIIGWTWTPERLSFTTSDLLNPRVQTLKLQKTQKLPQPWDFFGASVHHTHHSSAASSVCKGFSWDHISVG